MNFKIMNDTTHPTEPKQVSFETIVAVRMLEALAIRLIDPNTKEVTPCLAVIQKSTTP